MANLKQLYNNGINIMEFIRIHNRRSGNSTDAIQYSYDMQAGSYSAGFYENYDKTSTIILNGKHAKVTGKDKKELSGKYIAEIFNKLEYNSFIDVGTGEATTLSFIINNLQKIPKHIFASDISLSRILHAKKFALENCQSPIDINFFTADLFNMPFPDSSVDIVLTVHSIEPNTNKEKEALEELYRIAAKYLILIEPSFTLGNDATKENIIKHKYVKNLYETAKSLEYNIMEHRLFNVCLERNMNAVLVIKKDNMKLNGGGTLRAYACPICKNGMIFHNDNYFCEECLLLYPVINNIPVLQKECGILCSKYLEF